jgi:glycosyltransferase involved in cell wall biosynthesis
VPEVESGDLVVAVLTYKRPDDLPDVLPQLVAQLETVDLETWLLVVDNDAAGSARETVERLGLPSTRYVCEPTPGIAAARNRALDEAEGTRLLVFIDDDERPADGWLSALVECHRQERCAAVAGAVVPDVERVSDPWIAAGGFFVRQRHRTGTEQGAASTANLLIDLEELQRLGGIRFDEEFGLTGGSDTMFTRTITGRGGRIVWCDEAVVTDHVRTERVTRQWVLQRHFRSGNSWSRISVRLARGPLQRTRTRLRASLEGAARVVVGGSRTAVGFLTRSKRHQARGSRTVARGAGMVVGAWGGVYNEYGRDRARKRQHEQG